MKLEKIQSVYFVGIGGIGMSAIARYFLQKGGTYHTTGEGRGADSLRG